MNEKSALQLRNVIVSIVYSLFVTQLHWGEIRGYGFTDLENYLYRFNELSLYGSSIINSTNSLIGLVTSEALWAYLLFFMSKIGFDATTALNTISFICTFIVSFYILKNSKWYISVLLIINPILIDLFLSQHRSALALTIFVFSIQRSNKYIQFSLLFLSCFIHTFFFALSFIYLISQYIDYRLKKQKLIQVTNFFVFLTLSLSIVLGKDILLSLLNDRRAGGIGESVSFLYASFWLFVLLIISTLCNPLLNRAISLSVALLMLFSITTLFGGYSARYLTLAYPFIIVSVSSIKSVYPIVFFMSIFLYQSVQWIFWLRI